MDIQRAGYYVVPPRTIVDSRAVEVDIGAAEALNGLVLDSVLADADSLIHSEAVAVPVVVIAVAIAGPVVLIAIPTAAVRWFLLAVRPVGISLLSWVIPLSVSLVWLVARLRSVSAGSAATARIPKKIERIPFGAAFRIVDLHNGHPSVARIAHELLFAPAVYTGKAEIRRIGGHLARTFEAPPLCRLSGERSQGCGSASHLHLRRTVDHYFNRAFAPIGCSSADHGRLPLTLSEYPRCEHCTHRASSHDLVFHEAQRKQLQGHSLEWW